MTLVVDAAAVAELLLERPIGQLVEDRLREHEFDLHAPALLELEVLSTLRKLVASGEATAKRATDAIEDMLDLPVQHYGHGSLVERAWELRENFTPYDAAYVAVAESLSESGARLLTTDGRLARAVGRHTGVEVILVVDRS